jgi:hypothetical protein
MGPRGWKAAGRGGGVKAAAALDCAMSLKSDTCFGGETTISTGNV